jgi:hypothetical protein
MLAGRINKIDYIFLFQSFFFPVSYRHCRTIDLLVIDRHIRIAFDAV